MAKTLNIGTTPSGAGQVLENRPSVRYKIRKQIEKPNKGKRKETRWRKLVQSRKTIVSYTATQPNAARITTAEG